MKDFSYENVKRVVYDGGATFVPVCKRCGQFVAADLKIYTNKIGGLSPKPNATCKKCGRTRMIFEGFM